MFAIWDGRYPDFASAPGSLAVTGAGEGGFEGSEWLDKMVARARRNMAVLDGQEPVPTVALSQDYPLATVAALTRAEPLTIVDFGAGLANSYANVRSCLPGHRAFRFHCIENAAICRLGREIWGDCGGALHFHDSLDDAPERADIVHAGSAIQYVEDWQGLLRSLLMRKPSYLVLSDVPAGEIPTFVSLQAYYGRRMRHWFWNIGEFVTGVEALGVRLAYRSHYRGTYLGVEGPYPMDNFAPELRLGYSANLVFEPA